MSEMTGQKFGPYQILEEIGRGGMAAVYRAHDTATDEFVALKLVAPHLSKDPNFERRFQREAEVLRKLQHPHIIPVLDYGEAGGYAYLVMPLLQVGTLTDRLRAGPLDPREGARLIEQISDALQYAHDHGVVHRDVKPSNVLLDEQGNALLSDFGMARLREPGVSLTGSMLVGTPAYISPEQARGEKATYRSDQYSLGIVLYELTTGKLPFEAESPIAVALKHINEPLPAARQASPNVPKLVERVILKATAKDPRHRFASVAAMNLAFQDALKHSLDPTLTPAPKIELPPPVQSTLALSQDQAEPSRLRIYLTRAAGLALAMFLVLPAFGLARALGIAPGMERGLGDLSPVQMAQLNGTLQAMSTELAGTQADLMPADQIQTAVAATLLAGAGAGTPVPPTEAQAAQPGDPTTVALTPISTSLPSFGPGATPNATASASATPQSSALPLENPSETPTASQTPVPSPTDSPSATPTPTSTHTPTRTPTPVPTNTPQPSPTQDYCQALGLSGFNVDGKTVSWTVANGNTTGRQITRITLDWPDPPNTELKKIWLDNSMIWNEADPTPPTTADSNWKGSRWIPEGNTALRFDFESTAAPLGALYELELELEGGCEISSGG